MATRDRTCLLCAAQFTYVIARGTDRKYCSAACQSAAKVLALAARKATLPTCSIEWCDAPANRSKATLCERHYYQIRRNGTVLLPRRDAPRSELDLPSVPKATKEPKQKRGAGQERPAAQKTRVERQTFFSCQHCGVETKGSKWCSGRCASRAARGSTASASCAWCGEVFPRKGSHKYCGARCRDAAMLERVARVQEAKAAEGRDLTCTSCGDTFWHRRSPGAPPKICVNCRKKREGKKSLPRKSHEITCRWCGGIFESFVSTAMWCSIACGKKGRQSERPERREQALAKERQRRQKIKAADPHHGKRAMLRKLINTMKRMRNAKAQAERDSKPCDVCGKEVGPYRIKYCSPQCRDKSDVTRSIRRKVGRAYQAAKRTQTVVQFDPIEVFIRDKWTCRMCGVKTPKSLRGKHDPRSPELDHIVPLSKQGDHAPWNAQCLCRRCNRQKSDKAVGQLGLALL